MPLPKLVIFDCDGVLVDSEPVTNAVLVKDLNARGLNITLQEVNDLFVGGTIYGAGEKSRELGADIPPNWSDMIYAEMYDELRKGVPLIKGVEALMDGLDRAGVPYCVGSNGSEEKMSITLGHHPALQERLAGKLYSAHTYSVAKPDPDLLLIAARDHQTDPQDCIMIDDSPSGCRAAQRAGMRCFGLAEHHDGQNLAAVGATVVHSLDEVAQHLGL